MSKWEILKDQAKTKTGGYGWSPPSPIPVEPKELLELIATAEKGEEIHGNSPEHWYSKAMAYKGIVFEVCEAFRKLGYHGDFGNLDTLPERLNAHAVHVLQTLERGKETSPKPKTVVEEIWYEMSRHANGMQPSNVTLRMALAEAVEFIQRTNKQLDGMGIQYNNKSLPSILAILKGQKKRDIPKA